MLERLQEKWKVKGGQLVLIIATFAIGGSLTGYAGRKLLPYLGLHSGWQSVLAYILIIILLWPIAVIIVSIPFGQFAFFSKYIRKIGARIGIGKQEVIISKTPRPSATSNIAIFASGAGSNAQKIIDHFRNSDSVSIALIACNKPGTGVLAIAEKENIPTLLIEKDRFFNGDAYLKELKEKNIELIVLAGFLWKIPPVLIQGYSGKIINIHPALLPKYGGKGMYGHYVHEAVLTNKDTESGISIHYVDELYDHGQLILQVKCPVLPTDTADSLATRIHALEHQYYPSTIGKILGAVPA